MRAALAQTNPVVGDVEGNCERIRAELRRARAQTVDLVVFPELSVLGYPPRDLLQKRWLVEKNRRAVEALAAECRGIAALIGFVAANEQPVGRPLHNSAALCADGRVLSVHHKTLLPEYDVFDEFRYFEPGRDAQIGRLPLSDGRTLRLGVTICEDIWNEERIWGRRIYSQDPIETLVRAGADLLINISASPFWLGKPRARVELFSPQIARHRVPLLFVNQVGGNDELIFDGGSAAFGADGQLAARARLFEEDLLVVELPAGGTPTGRKESVGDDEDQVLDALILGTRDYVRKCGFREVVVGLSGGVDSALTAAVAAAALGSQCVHGLAMPSRYSSAHSLEDAEQTARALEIDYRVVPIKPLHEAYERELAPAFAGRAPDVTEENLQARIRGSILMAMSNKFGWLLLTTGNKSELAVGYCTMYGDMCGGLAVISDVPKTMVYRLAERINRRAGREVIPRRTLTKVPSAELRPDQTDQDTLPPYPLLDKILQLYVEQDESFEHMARQLQGEPGYREQVLRDVIRMVDRSEYKRKQAAQGLKVTSRAFGTGRRMPVAARF